MAYAVGDHLEHLPAGDHSGAPRARPGAVYRVVGTADGVALLRLTDQDGRRRYTGDLVRLDRASVRTAFDPTANPDAGLALRHRLRTLAAGAYWSVRRVLP